MTELQIEVNTRADFEDPKGAVAITPPIDENYWLARVPLFKDQAIVCFPKFWTIGCGFAQEQDWNTNLPLRGDADEIYRHIRHNKKYEEITDEMCLTAIRMLQAYVLPMFPKKPEQDPAPSAGGGGASNT